MKKILPILTLLFGCAFLLQISVTFAANAPTFLQTIIDGTQSVDIVDASGNAVSSPAVTFAGLTFSFDAQTGTGTLGNASAKIRVFNPTADVTWNVSVAATSGGASTWSSGGNSYDYNDSNGSGADDADTDSVGGRLTIDPSTGIVTGVPNDSACSPSAGIAKGSSASFQEVAPSIASITLLTGGASASPYCRWDLNGVSVFQAVPAGQVSGTYTISFTVTIA